MSDCYVPLVISLATLSYQTGWAYVEITTPAFTTATFTTTLFMLSRPSSEVFKSGVVLRQGRLGHGGHTGNQLLYGVPIKARIEKVKADDSGLQSRSARTHGNRPLQTNATSHIISENLIKMWVSLRGVLHQELAEIPLPSTAKAIRIDFDIE
ncbi:hypothetical protein B0H14DRAFT_2573034 [Mycena olivaceomarginata]|nr:hypothetical protein B0H14DRAFT_2573034 [Mycena olivaceomarginata]